MLHSLAFYTQPGFVCALLVNFLLENWGGELHTAPNNRSKEHTSQGSTMFGIDCDHFQFLIRISFIRANKANVSINTWEWNIFTENIFTELEFWAATCHTCPFIRQGEGLNMILNRKCNREQSTCLNFNQINKVVWFTFKN